MAVQVFHFDYGFVERFSSHFFPGRPRIRKEKKRKEKKRKEKKRCQGLRPLPCRGG
jgi:hypothetical protein